MPTLANLRRSMPVENVISRSLSSWPTFLQHFVAVCRTQDEPVRRGSGNRAPKSRASHAGPLWPAFSVELTATVGKSLELPVVGDLAPARPDGRNRVALNVGTVDDPGEAASQKKNREHERTNGEAKG